jgi:hypothetical protein
LAFVEAPLPKMPYVSEFYKPDNTFWYLWKR